MSVIKLRDSISQKLRGQKYWIFRIFGQSGWKSSYEMFMMYKKITREVAQEEGTAKVCLLLFSHPVAVTVYLFCPQLRRSSHTIRTTKPHKNSKLSDLKEVWQELLRDQNDKKYCLWLQPKKELRMSQLLLLKQVGILSQKNCWIQRQTMWALKSGRSNSLQGGLELKHPVTINT